MLPPAQVEILKKFFANEIYPSDDELTNLEKECGAVCLGEMRPLSTKQIRDWFARARLAQKRETHQLEGCDEIGNQENQEPESHVAGELGEKRRWLTTVNSRTTGRAFSPAHVAALKKFFAEDAHPNSARLEVITNECNSICAAEKKKLSKIQVKSWFVRARFAQKRGTLQLEGSDENTDVEARKATKRQRSPSFDDSDAPNLTIHQQLTSPAPHTIDEDYEPLMKKQCLGLFTTPDSLLHDETPQNAEKEDAGIPEGYKYSWEKAFKVARDKVPEFSGRIGEDFKEYLRAFEVIVLKNQHFNDVMKNEMLWFTIHRPARNLLARSHNEGIALAKSLHALSTHYIWIPENLKLLEEFEFDPKASESSFNELKRILEGLAQYSGLKDPAFVGSLLKKLPTEFQLWKEALQTGNQAISPNLLMKMLSRYFKVKY